MEADADQILEVLRHIVPAVGAVFGTNAEVILHDLRKPDESIIAIANGHITGRVLGGPLVGGPFGDVAYKWLVQYGDKTQTKTYETRSKDGKRLQSTTVLYRDANRNPIAALCINIDVTSIAAMERWANNILFHEGQHEDHESPSASSDVEDVFQELIEDALALLPTDRPDKLSKANRTKVVRELDNRGAFLIRDSVKRVSQALGVSKFTIYNDLDEVRSG